VPEVAIYSQHQATPTRPTPAGFDGSLDATTRELCRLIESLRQSASEIEDPAARVRAVEQGMKRMLAAADVMSAEGATALRELRRAGWTFAEISDETGYP